MSIINPASILLLIIILECLWRICRNKKEIWSPLTFLSAYLAYYVVLPSFDDEILMSAEAHYLVQFGGLLFYIIFLLSYKLYKPSKEFKSFNKCFSQEQNYGKYGITLFLIAFFSYTLIKGFSIYVFAGTDVESNGFDESLYYNRSSDYLTSLISLFCVSASLLYASKKKFDLFQIILMLISISIYLIGGSRFRILSFIIVLLVVYYLYPKVKRVKLLYVLPLLFTIYIGMGVIERSRHYGIGLDINIAKSIIIGQDLESMTAKENTLVYTFSGKVMEKFDERIYFEPLTCAVLMPIPRSVFPWKPNGDYLIKSKLLVDGTLAYGSAFTSFTEAYISFGWLGIILYGLFWGLISKRVWYNYKRNCSNFASILLLALFNAVLYVAVSRGYLAQVFKVSVYYIFIPFWIDMICRKVQISRS